MPKNVVNKSHLRIVLSFLSALSVMGHTGNASAGGPSVKKTTLRGVGEPKGTFRRSISGLTLTDVTWTVRNAGEETAESISVTVVVPGGKSIELRGPDTLAPNKQGTYSASPYDYVISDQKLKGHVSCGNCNF